jgi:hypothetical protein
LDSFGKCKDQVALDVLQGLLRRRLLLPSQKRPLEMVGT